MVLRDAHTQRVLRQDVVNGEAGAVFGAHGRVFDSVARMLGVTAPEVQLPPSASHPQAYLMYLRGRGLLAEYADPKNIDGSIDAFIKAIALDSGFAPAHASIGEAYWRRFEQTRERQWLEAARRSCDAAVALDRALAAAHVCLGVMYNGARRFEDAAAAFQLAVDQEPTSDDAHRGLARAFEGLGNSERAEQTYQHAIAIRPTYWAGYNWLGAFYNDYGCYRQAAAEFSKAIALSPGNARMYYNRGAVQAVMGRYNEAVVDLTDSIALRPSATAYLNLGTVYFRLKNFEAAVRAYEQADERAGTQFQVAGSLAYGYYYWKPSWRSKGIAATRRAIDLGRQEFIVTPHDSLVRARLALLLALLDDRPAALEHLEEVARNATVNGASAFMAAVAYQQLGDTANALTWLERAVGLRYPPADIRIAVEFEGLTNNPEFERILRLAPARTGQKFSCEGEQ